MRRIGPLVIVTILVAAALALTACSGQPTGAGSGTNGGTPSNGGSGSESIDAQALIEERCTVCHDVTRIKQAQHDAAAWQSTVERMRGKGAGVNDAEAAAIVDFLGGGGGSKL